VNTQELVEAFQKFIGDPRQNEPSWKALVGTEPSLLRRTLQDLVVGTESLTEAVIVLNPCWVLLQSRDFLNAITTFYRDKRQGFVNADRLSRNVKALIATAMTAAAADRLVKGEKGVTALLTSWAGRAADLLSSRDELQVGISPVRAAANDAASFVHGAFDKLAAQRRGGVAPRYWSLCWLGSEREKDLETARLAIPVAAANRTGRGFIGDLILNRLSDGSAPELIEHPDNALLALGDSLLAGMRRAWESVPSKESACWRLKFGVGAQDGDSLSGAAAVGFNNLFAGRRFIPTCLIIARLDADMERLLPAGGYQEKLSEAQKENIRIAVVAEDPENRISQRLQNVQIKQVSTLTEAIQHASGLPGERKLLGRYVCERPLHTNSFDRWIGEDVEDNTSQLIKTWELERLEKNFRRALWDNELRTMYKVSSSPRAKDFLVVMKDAGIDHDIGQFVMVMDAKEYDTLDIALAKRSENPWLQASTLRAPSERRKLWEALLRIARGVRLLHRQRVIHRSITAENIFLSITPDGRFDTWRLGGFEWSVRFGELVPKGPQPEWAIPPEYAESTGTEVSFEADWYGFGMLAARCFYQIESLSNQPAKILNDLVMERLDAPEALTPKEVNLIRRLVDSQPASRVHSGEDILSNLREIIHALAETALSENRDNPLVLVLDVNRTEFAEKSEAAGFKPPPGDDPENPKLQYDKYDSEHKVRLKEFLIEDLQEGQVYYVEDSSKYLLAGRHLVIALSPFRDDRKGIKPNWDFAYAEYTTALIGGTPVGKLKEAKLVVRFRTEITTNTRSRNWQPFLPREEQRSSESLELETFREFLRCTNQLELMMCCAEIFPYRLMENLDAGLATERIRIEPRPGKEDLEIFQRDGLIEFMRRQAMSRVGEDRVYLSEEDTVNLGRKPDTEAWKVEKTEDSYLILSRTADPKLARPPKDGFLRSTGFYGQIELIRRRKEAIDRLEEHSYLLRALARPGDVLVDTKQRDLPHEMLGDAVDESKIAVMQDILRVRPVYALQGPPGTGKTTLVAHLLRQILAEDPVAQILVTAQAHPAVDVLRDKVRSVFKDSGLDQIAVRLKPKSTDRYNPSDVEGTVENTTRDLASKITDYFDLHPPQSAIQKRWHEYISPLCLPAAVTSPEFADMKRLVQKGASIVYCTTSARDLEEIAEGTQSFDWTVVEEAGKVHGCDLALPLQAGHRWLLLGDQKQLRPYRIEDFEKGMLNLNAVVTFLKDLSGADRSIVDTDWITTWEARGEARDLAVEQEEYSPSQQDFQKYAKDWLPSFDRILRLTRIRGTTRDQPIGAASGILSGQYRMHPVIGRLISTCFYEDIVKNRTTDSAGQPLPRVLHGFVEPYQIADKALVWLNLPWCGRRETRDFVENSTPPYTNDQEAQAVRWLLGQLRLAETPSTPLELAVLSPYGKQVRLLGKKLENLRLRGNELVARPGLSEAGTDKLIHTVDSFQGNQADVVVVSLVRNNNKEAPRGLGFLDRPERLNVLLSRAERLLVIVGCWEFFELQVAGVLASDTKHPLWPWKRAMEYIKECIGQGTAVKIDYSASVGAVP
jgi:hypothetical protein